ncbi:hypothetical protein L2E82_06185 [Cichorium intybus]|uniref:Uncharacterized protein n=1 Tax=Cichorium intybus TaxID=13427 RepID=A0ACB9HAK1_CICIN|nr:hypothetical protein L2E82_06185 [Cichorium intybus]
MTMIRTLVRFGRRQLHTIVSREIIKPSSPTPSHLKTHNLSLLDQMSVNTFMPMITFYPNTGSYPNRHDKTLDLKNSLSQTLTKYYPFAGRHAKLAPACVDCNDNGAEFLEATVDRTLSDFLQNSKHEDLDQFFPHGLVNEKSNRGDHDLQSDDVIPLAVQVNHFECGGVAVAVSLSHKIADACSLAHLIHDWAKTTRFCSGDQKHDESPIDPQFIPLEYMNINYTGLSLERSNDCVTRSFMFPNSKINHLKLKVKTMTSESGTPITNPTRVEVLNWLLYKCAVEAATKNNSGSFKPTGVSHLTNIRSKMIKPLPENTMGNLFMIIDIQTKNESGMKPESFINEFKMKKMFFQSLPDVETTFGLLLNMCTKPALEEHQRKLDVSYICTSLCRYPAYEIDFGWGKPVKVAVAGDLRKNSFILLDAPNGDGIEALVCLGKQDMKIIQSDPELLAFL